MGWGALWKLAGVGVLFSAACGDARESQPEDSSTSAPVDATATPPPSTTSFTITAPAEDELPRPVPSWCGRVTVPMVTEAEQQRLADEFIRRNTNTNKAFAHSSSTQYLTGGLAFRAAGDPRVTDDAGAIAAARKLAEKNADLFGFTPAEVRGAEASVRYIMGNRWVDLRRDIPRKGYEQFPSVARNVRLRVSFISGMGISSSSPLRDFKLCLEAPLPAASAKIKEGAIERWPQRRGSRWQPTVSDITGVEPTIFVESDHQARTITLTRAYEVKLGEMTSAFVDASSGVRLGIQSSIVEANASMEADLSSFAGSASPATIAR